MDTLEFTFRVIRALKQILSLEMVWIYTQITGFK